MTSIVRPALIIDGQIYPPRRLVVGDIPTEVQIDISEKYTAMTGFICQYDSSPLWMIEVTLNHKFGLA